ncbi:MAG: hypothetical protein Fur0032_01410 [Terrimicrobiaceae bacterium]
MFSGLADGLMCGMMNIIQHRTGQEAVTSQDLLDYVERCRPLTRETFYSVEGTPDFQQFPSRLLWSSPRPSGHRENDLVQANLFPPPAGETGPWVIILHALMSASDIGYRRVAAWFQARGWGAAFPHLPFHYSRVPKGTFNGELAITSHLIRNAETLRQGVCEVRQLIQRLRARGAKNIGILGTSYGGWTGALTSFLEPDFRFLALVQPIADVETAIWENPGAATMRRQLRARGITPGMTQGHSHLSSPLHGVPLCDPSAIILTTGRFDRVSPPEALRELAARWRATCEIEVHQGHFGYSALPATLTALEEKNLLD